MSKKKICLITNWYPTKGNPYQGLFFREQAIALSSYYDFVVLHYEYTGSRLKEITDLILEKKEENITEYTAKICSSTLHKWMMKVTDRGTTDYKEYLYKKIFDQLADENIDIFYSISGQTEAALTAKYAHHFNKPYVVAEHGPFPWVGTLLTEENKKAIEEADAFLAISNDKVRQILMQSIKLPKIHYVGNMVDEHIFTYTNSGNKVKTFITVGANVFYKNYEMLIDIFNRLSDLTDIPFKLMVVGYQANKGYSQNSEELVRNFKNSKFGNSVELIPHVPHDEMPAMYAKADAFVMTSIQEGQPVSAIEAGCCGLPIFATRCGGVEDYVDDSIGRIVDLLDSEGLAKCLKAYLEGKTAFDSQQIRENVKKKFGKEAFIRNMVNAFESV